jgi:hypothetical protein
MKTEPATSLAFDPTMSSRISNFTLMLSAMILNAFDACMTLTFLATGQFQEWNPIMRRLLEQPAWIFWAVKIGGFTILIGFLRYIAEFRDIGRTGLWIVNMIYTLVALWHCCLLITTQL